MSRYASVVLATCALALSSPARAALRSPQVPILGGSLQAYLTGMGESISVGTQQDAMQSWSATFNNNPSYSIQVEIGLGSPDLSIGLYNANDASPALYELFPTGATQGWFAVASYRIAPVRVVVNTFDADAQLVFTRTYFGGDRYGIAFYGSSPSGVLYTQDARNPEGRAQFVVFAGTGVNAGAWWIAGEETPVAGGASDQDFDDVVLFLELPDCACPVVKCSWGTLKERFR